MTNFVMLDFKKCNLSILYCRMDDLLFLLYSCVNYYASEFKFLFVLQYTRCNAH